MRAKDYGHKACKQPPNPFRSPILKAERSFLSWF
jgi:hypothetical protein